jgi:arylsulfatase A-like enzyme
MKRQFVISAMLLNLCVFSSVIFSQAISAAETKPNVVIILTDDQGFGELGVTGNPIVRTPQMDHFAAQSVSLNNFNVMPVCSPTRACLMTGRNYYRTGLVDTWMGSSLIDPSSITIAQMFSAAGYHTGIFGKWHLGDNYPRRPEDKGFQEALVLNGGGLAQPGDPPDPVDEQGAYFNAILRHNGVWKKTKGYVGDVCTAAAMQFIETNPNQPFFAYLAFNLPHAPHQVPVEYSEHYPAKDFDPTNFPSKGHPMQTKQNPQDLAKVYGMIEDIDDNVGKLLAKLDELNLSSKTIVMLFSDNGCQQHPFQTLRSPRMSRT